MYIIKIPYYPQLDSLRFIALFLVLLTHWLDYPFISTLQLGRFGVDVFFVLSSFLITSNLLRIKSFGFSLQDWKAFLIRRGLRIFPLYYLVLLVTFFWGGMIFRESVLWNSFYLSNFFIINQNSWQGPISPFWSLSVEEHFYLVWPFLVWLLTSIQLKKILYFIVIISFGFRFYYFINQESIFHILISTVSCLECFVFGSFLALYQQRINSDVSRTQKIFLVLISVASIFVVFNLIYSRNYNSFLNSVIYRTANSVLSVIVVHLLVNREFQFMNNRVLVSLGKMSYSMYLIHCIIPGMLLGIDFNDNQLLKFGCYFIVLLILSKISWEYFEKKILAYKSNFKYSFE